MPRLGRGFCTWSLLARSSGDMQRRARGDVAAQRRASRAGGAVHEVAGTARCGPRVLAASW